MDNKAFTAKIAKKLGSSDNDVNRLVDALCTVFKECGSEIDSIAIPGFGTFKASKSDEEIVVDETTGKRTLCPPKISMSFQPSVVLRKKLQS